MAAAVDVSRITARLADMAVDLARRLGDEFVAQAQSNASRRTGELAESIQVTDVTGSFDGASAHVEVGAEHGIYQEEGTGIYGPDGVPITPRSSSVLVFDWPAAGGIVFAREVQGSEPTRFWSRTVLEWPRIVGEVAR